MMYIMCCILFCIVSFSLFFLSYREAVLRAGPDGLPGRHCSAVGPRLRHRHTEV